MSTSDRDMTTPFERRLSIELLALSEVAVRDTPASIVARSAVGAEPVWRWPFTPATRAVALVLVVAAIAGALFVAWAGAPRHAPLPQFRTGDLAYLTETGALYLAHADGSSPRKIRDSIDGIDWSPTGRYLAAYGIGLPGKMATYVLDADGRLRSRIDDAGEAIWTPADELVMDTYRDVPTLRVYRVDGSLARTLAWPPGVARLKERTVSPDGRSMIVLGCERCDGSKYDDLPTLGWDLWRIDLDGGPAVRLTQTSEEQKYGMRWTAGDVFEYRVFCWTRPDAGACPDGDSTSWSMAADGTGRHEVSPQPDGAPSPDGSRVATEVQISATTTRVHVVDPAQGTDTELVAGPGADEAVGWSPAGDRILLSEQTWDAYAGGYEDYSLWLVGADGSNPHKIVDASATGAWEPLPVTDP